MYTDERYCIPCLNKGLFTDGDNYCSKCKNYLCLACAKGHGFQCGGKGALDSGIESHLGKYKGWEKSAVTNFKTPFNTRYAVNEVLPKTLFISDSIKKPLFQIKNIGAKTSNELICQSGGRKNYDRNQEVFNNVEQTGSAATEKNVRQTYSARGGAVRITRALTNNEKKIYRCCEHPDMVIENFCTIHGALCCENCLGLMHKQCTIQPIDEVAHDVFESGIVEKFTEEFSIAKVKIIEIADRCDLCIAFKRNRKQTEKKKTKDKVVGEKELEILKTRCNELYENVSISLAEIKNAKHSKSEVFTFITLKRNENMLIHAKAKISEMIEKCELVLPKGNKSSLRVMHCREIRNDKESKFLRNTMKENIPNQMPTSSQVSNKTVIGDVVLHLNGTEKMNDNSNHHFYDDEIVENKDVGYEEIELTKQENERSEFQDKDITNTLLSKAKSVDFTADSNSKNAFEKPSNHRLKTYGLTTEYYMKNEDDGFGEIRVLRLQSAPPERVTVLFKDSNNRSNSANTQTDSMMFQGQNNFPKQSSACEQPDHKNVLDGRNCKQSGSAKDMVVNESNVMTGGNVRKNTSDETTKQQATNSMKIHKNDTKYVRQSGAYKYVKSKRSKPLYQCRKKSILSKAKPNESTLATIIRNHERTGEDYRLKQWIKQTEEMSKTHMNRNKNVSVNSSENTMVGLDENCEVLTKDGNDSCDEECCISTVSLTTREAKVIKVLDPDNRNSSAKSRTSESDEVHYIKHSFAHPPRSQLVLSKELIVRIPEDELVCEINSIACLPDGRVLVSDFSNMQLKLLSVENVSVANIKLDEPPHDVTVVSNSIAAAITGLAYDVMFIFSIGQGLTIKRRLKTDCVCKAIDSYESHIYLLCLYRYRTEIHILSIDGVISIRFNLGNAVPSPKSIAINALNGLIYLIDQNRGLYKVERCGKIVSRCFDNNIEQYIDVETDLNNTIFVSTKNPNGIYELDYDGKHLLPILFDYRAEVVKTIAYNTANNSLVVGYANAEAIQIYKIHNSLGWKKK